MVMSLSSLHLDAVVACAATRNFTLAAEKLAITQSARSQRIKNLEFDLSTSLFIRSRSGVSLTEAGMELLRYCQRKDAMENEVIAQIKGVSGGGLRGEIRLAGFSTIMRSVVMPALSSLLIKNPNIRVHFLIREMNELPQLLQTGEADFIFTDEQLSRDAVQSKEVGFEQNILIQKKNYSGPEIYLDHDEFDETTKKYLSRFKKKQKFERRYYDDAYSILEAVKLGLGIAVLPKHLVKSEPDLQIVDGKNVLESSIYLHYFKQDFFTQLQSEVIAAIDSKFKTFLQIS